MVKKTSAYKYSQKDCDYSNNYGCNCSNNYGCSCSNDCGCDCSNDCGCDYSSDCECDCSDGCNPKYKFVEIYKIPFHSPIIVPPNSTVRSEDSGYITDYKYDTKYDIDVDPKYFRSIVESSVINMSNEQLTFVNAYGSYVMQYSYKVGSGKKNDIIACGLVYGATGKFAPFNGKFEAIKGLNNIKFVVTFTK